MKKLIIILAIAACATIAQAQSILQPYPNAGRPEPQGYWIPDSYPSTAPRGGYTTTPMPGGPTYGFGNDSRDNFITHPTPAGRYTFGRDRLFDDD